MLYANNTRMRTMRASKSIINKYISKPTQLFSKFRNILLIYFDFKSFIILLESFFLRIKPNILAKEDLAFGAVDFVDHMLANAVIEESNWFSQHGLQGIQEGFEGIFLVLSSIGASEVREEDYGLGAMLHKMLDGRYGA